MANSICQMAESPSELIIVSALKPFENFPCLPAVKLDWLQLLIPLHRFLLRQASTSYSCQQWRNKADTVTNQRAPSPPHSSTMVQLHHSSAFTTWWESSECRPNTTLYSAFGLLAPTDKVSHSKTRNSIALVSSLTPLFTSEPRCHIDYLECSVKLFSFVLLLDYLVANSSEIQLVQSLSHLLCGVVYSPNPYWHKPVNCINIMSLNIRPLFGGYPFQGKWLSVRWDAVLRVSITSNT